MAANVAESSNGKGLINNIPGPMDIIPRPMNNVPGPVHKTPRPMNNAPSPMINPELTKRRKLNISQKIELIKFIDSDPKMKKKDIAAMYGIPINTVSTIYSNREKLLQRSECDFSNLSKMRIRASSFPEVEDALIQWYIKERAENPSERPSGNMLRLQALEIAKSLGIDNFLASNGWIERFKVRHNLKMYRYKKKNSSSAADVALNDSFDLDKSGASLNENSSELENNNAVNPNIWEYDSNPAELLKVKQECHSPETFYPQDHEYETEPSHIIPDQHVDANLMVTHEVTPCISYSDPKRNQGDINVKELEEAYYVIYRYLTNCRKCNVPQKTFEALKEIRSFVSSERDKKSQCKITDFFTQK